MGSRVFQLLKSVNLYSSTSRYLHTSRIKQSDDLHTSRIKQSGGVTDLQNSGLKQSGDVTDLHTSGIKQSDDVTASLPYYDPTTEETKWVDCMVKDGRGQKFTLERNGFDIMKHVTSFSYDDFQNEEKIYSTYYKEMEEALKQHTGAALCQIIHIPKVRKVESMKSHTGGGLFFIHSVSTKYFNPYIDKQYLKGRYLAMDVWRNITDTPVAKNTLAVLDSTSMSYPDDYIHCGYSDPAYYGDERPPTPTLRLLDDNKDKHKWFYFPRMKKDEVLLLHQWDSEIPDSQMCFHSAFEDPNTPKDAPPRETCDVRAICFFPTKEPWNI